MKYRCRDCGAKIEALSHGRCPACGSSKVANITKARQPKLADKSPKKPASPAKTFLLILLWALLLYKAYENLFS